MTNIPLIDFKRFDSGEENERRRISEEVNKAASEVGFMYAKNLGIDQIILQDAFNSSVKFFKQPLSEKSKLSYVQDMNHGYQGVGEQRLDSQFAPDLKEAFTMRDVPLREKFLNLWPSNEFRRIAVRAFGECLRGSNIVMEAFAIALDLPTKYFRERHKGENVALRYLHYPISGKNLSENQLGAGAHTDFGTITLLFQDDVGGLQIQNRSGQWLDAVHIPGTVIVNTADLIATWTNDRYCSSPHRVRAITGDRERYSIAFFVDPDTDVPVSAFDSCVSVGQPAKYPATTAGAYVAQRIAESNDISG